VFFVTRPKHNTAYEVVETRPVVEHSLIVADEIIRLTGPQAQRDCPALLRRIEVVVPESGEVLTLLTNHLAFAATTVAAVYKDRWQIELLFKALKQHLRIKTFVGTSATALHIQIWTALIALLILRYLQLRARFTWSFSNLAALLRMNLFVHRDLWRWLDQPFAAPPDIPEKVQTEFAFA
jgi:IS4 transposase